MAVFPKYRWHKIVLPLFISGLILSCSPLNLFGLASQEYTNINELSRLSNQRVVYVHGLVVNVAPFLEGGAYQIQDATGSVWIKTDKPLPPKGTSLVVRGEIAYQAIFIGQDKLGESYILELAQESEEGTKTSQPPLKLPIQAQENPPPIISPEPSSSPIVEPKPNETTPDVPVSIPIAKPTVKPTTKPSAIPTAKPTVKPTTKPSATPTAKPSPSPTTKPATSSSPKPSPQSQVNPKFNPDEQFLPHKQLYKK